MIFLIAVAVGGFIVYFTYTTRSQEDVTITVAEKRDPRQVVVESKEGETFMTVDPGPADAELYGRLKVGKQYHCVAAGNDAIRRIPYFGWRSLVSCEPAK